VSPWDQTVAFSTKNDTRAVGPEGESDAAERASSGKTRDGVGSDLPTALDNGIRAPRALLRKVVARLLGKRA